MNIHSLDFQKLILIIFIFWKVFSDMNDKFIIFCCLVVFCFHKQLFSLFSFLGVDQSLYGNAFSISVLDLVQINLQMESAQIDSLIQSSLLF